MNEWISCERDGLPEIGQIVFVCDIYNTFVSIGKLVREKDGYYFDLMWIDNVEDDSLPTHWMPLPRLPEVYNE